MYAQAFSIEGRTYPSLWQLTCAGKATLPGGQRARERPDRRGQRRNRPEIGPLEQRVLLSNGLVDRPQPPPAQVGPLCFEIDPAPSEEFFASQTQAASSIDGTTVKYPLSDLPALSSLPGAKASLFLDFRGDSQSSWGTYTNFTTPVYDKDGDTSTFSDGELASIRTIWTSVAEDYSPFNLNVTTVRPTSMAHGLTQRVVIGGDGAWTGCRWGGLAYVDSFTSTYTGNVCFVFATNLGSGDAKYTADAASHEAGHAFGLQHQSTYVGTQKTDEYRLGNGDGTGPLMGKSYYSSRSLWAYGTSSLSASSMQDDLAILARSANGFGYRSDSSNSSPATALPLSVSGSQVSIAGLLVRSTETDYYWFTSDAGVANFTVSGPAGVSNLAPRIDLLDAAGSTLIASASASGSNFTAQFTATLPAAALYTLMITSSGGYGNIGQYSVGGTITPWNGAANSLIDAPTNLVATAGASGQIDLAWRAPAFVGLGFLLERSNDGVNWTTIAANLAPSVTRFTDLAAAPGMSYGYQVRVLGPANGTSPSNVAWVATLPQPTSMPALIASANRIGVSWTEVEGEHGFQIERTTDGINWLVVGTTGIGVTSFADTTVSQGCGYSYRVRSIGSGGFSALSPVATVATPLAASPPTAVSNLTAVPLAPNRVLVQWTATTTNVKGFIIEQSSNGRRWLTVGRVKAFASSWIDTRVVANKAYFYRVRAFNPWGTSPAVSTVRVVTPRKQVAKRVNRSVKRAAPSPTTSTPRSPSNTHFGVNPSPILSAHQEIVSSLPFLPANAVAVDQVMKTFPRFGKASRRLLSDHVTA